MLTAARYGHRDILRDLVNDFGCDKDAVREVCCLVELDVCDFNCERDLCSSREVFVPSAPLTNSNSSLLTILSSVLCFVQEECIGVAAISVQ